MTQEDTALGDFAMAKLSRVLGPAVATEEFSAALQAAGLEAVETADDLERLANALRARPGFVATVGAMLAVEAAMRRLGGR